MATGDTGRCVPCTPLRRPERQAQQPFCCWIGGHGTLPQEQNTQQSPAFG